MNPVNIVTAADAAYVPHVGAMLHSLFERNPDLNFSIYFLRRTGLDTDHIAKLSAVCRTFGASFTDREVDGALLAGLPVGGWYVEEAWYRVFIPGILPEINRVLWLDADVIVLDSIKALWQTDLGDCSLAACPNALLYQARHTVAALGVKDRSRYFNTGVLLLDLNRMRREKSEIALREAATKYREWIKFADQDVLNAVYYENYKRLPLYWNVLTHSYINVPETLRVHGKAEYTEAMRSPRIVHFTGRTSKKPWSARCGHPYRYAYLHHRAAAGWPPPEFAESNLKISLVSRLPLRLREIMNAAVRGNFSEACSYLFRW